MKILQGTKHQGSDIHLRPMGGSSCMANSLIALSYSYICCPVNWIPNDIDNILDMGYNLYMAIFEHRIDKSSDYFQICDLKRTFLCKDHQFSCEPGSSFMGHFSQTKSNDVTYTLKDALQLAFDICPTAILIIQQYSISVNVVDNQYYVFDPHSRNAQGLCAPDGSAVLVTCSNVNNLCLYIKALVRTLTDEITYSTAQFEVTAILLIHYDLDYYVGKIKNKPITQSEKEKKKKRI